MGLRISINLDDEDLKHFRLIMREARKASARHQPEDIVAAAELILASVNRKRVPKFVLDRLTKLEIMIRMLTDHEWRLPQKDTVRVLNALAYFSEPEDLIPDHIPGLGFLDDAIMIELVVRELRHEIDAYEDFCDFRLHHDRRKGIKSKTSDITRDSWLAGRREELQARMRRRRKKGSTSGKAPKIL
ncbi:MAG: YkvA family protein [Woeseiaceae bacterium]